MEIPLEKFQEFKDLYMKELNLEIPDSEAQEKALSLYFMTVCMKPQLPKITSNEQMSLLNKRIYQIISDFTCNIMRRLRDHMRTKNGRESGKAVTNSP